MSHVVSYQRRFLNRCLLNQSGIISWKGLSFTLWLVRGAASSMLSWWSTWPLFPDITSAQNVRKQRSDASQRRLCKMVFTLMINTDWMQSANPNKALSSDIQVYIRSFGSLIHWVVFPPPLSVQLIKSWRRFPRTRCDCCPARRWSHPSLTWWRSWSRTRSMLEPQT